MTDVMDRADEAPAESDVRPSRARAARIPALDFRPKAERVPPANIEAEQALLGVLLYDNDAFHRFEGLTAEHFYEPFHGRLYRAIAADIMKGVVADPITLAERFRRDPAFQELGEVRYLADLVDRAPPAANAASYASAIVDRSLRREVIRIAGEAVEAADADEDKTGREIVDDMEQGLYQLAETGAAQGFRTFEDYLTGAVEMASEAYSRDGGLAGIPTNLIDLDQKLGGLHPSDLIIVAARPSMGKTALATNIAYAVAARYAYEVRPDGERKTTSGGVVGFFSLEMSGEQLAMRILAEVSGVSGDRLRKGQVEPTEFGRVRDAALEIKSAPLHIDATGGLTIGKLGARARRLKRTVGLDLIVVDYLQLLAGDKRYDGGQRVQEVSEITVKLKALAKELNVPVIALSQLSRQVENREDKKPQLSDLRESGSIEQDADCVMFLYREAYYLSRAEPRPDTPEHLTWQEQMDQVSGLAEVIIGKQRHGPIGTVRLSFNEHLTKFSNLARDTHFSDAAGRLPFKDS